jgi:predicted O-methyltransferase YrrM
MSQTSMTEFERYLRAKRSVDDRSLNRRVWARLDRELRKRRAAEIRVVEAGAGIGAGAERFHEWKLFEPTPFGYTGIEPAKELAEQARLRLAELPISSTIEAVTLEEFAGSRENQGIFDLVVAHALLDMLDLTPALASLVALARPGGLLYFPITFDGETIFEPAADGDDLVLPIYHDTMQRKGRTGRRLFHALRDLSAEVLETGSSDWVVHPKAGGYEGDEAFFLEFLVRTVERAIRDRIDREILGAWVSCRREQIRSAELFYCAHQLDVLARRNG